MYKIGDFSKLCNLPVSTLRYYDKEGLLTPEIIDCFTDYRYYSGENLKRINVITALKNAGFSLNEIKVIISTGENITSVLQNKENELKNQLSEINDRLTRLSLIRNNIEKVSESMYGVVVKDNISFKAVSVRRLLSGRKQVDEAITEITNYLQQNGITANGAVVINYEFERIPPLDFEVCVKFSEKLPKDCPYTEKIVEISEKCACVTGDMKDIDNCYDTLVTYVCENSYQMIGAYYEQYYENDVVEIAVPVCKLSERMRTPKCDNTDIPFEDDPSVIGKWEVIDCLNYREQFNIDKIKYNDKKSVKHLHFLPNGEEYWCYRWTKGFILTHFGDGWTGTNKYTVETINGINYMFTEMKQSDYHLFNGRPHLWVLRQTDNLPRKKEDIAVFDDTEMPFVYDDAVVGKWESCNFVVEISQHDPDNPYFSDKENLYWKTVEFAADGNCRVELKDKMLQQPYFTWTKGYILGHISKIAEAYEIHFIKGCNYLFVEWKSGDYTFGGRKPCYYVFRRN